MSDMERGPEGHHERREESFRIEIDRTEYRVHREVMNGHELRHVPHPPISHDHDLFEVVPEGSDRKIGDDERVEMRNGLRFFTKTREESFHIQIDRTEYTVHKKVMNGLELRHLPTPPIGPDRDLFEVVPGGTDKKIADNEPVEMHNGLRFFTAPAQINPGRPHRETIRNVAAA